MENRLNEIMANSWLAFLWLFFEFFGLQCVECLLVTDINVPQIVDFRDNVTLSCSYDISGHTLNSVKWYKNDMEFFRYSPLMQPIYMKFPVDGIQMNDGKNECNESSCRIELNLLGAKSSGIYRCEVSGDAPHFKLTASTANMSVEALPQNNPLINNFHSVYRYDDFVQANCTTDFSSLQTKLNWYINGEKASFMDLQPSIETTIAAHDYNLRRMITQLNFYANDPRFHKQLQLQQPQQLQQQKQSKLHELQQQQQQKQQDKHHQTNHGMPSFKLSLKLSCVAEIENYPELRRETTLNALLLRDDIDLKNQKLINSVATKYFVSHAQQLLLIVATTATLTAISTRLTFQYGNRKSTRFKGNAMR